MDDLVWNVLRNKIGLEYMKENQETHEGTLHQTHSEILTLGHLPIILAPGLTSDCGSSPTCLQNQAAGTLRDPMRYPTMDPSNWPACGLPHMTHPWPTTTHTESLSRWLRNNFPRLNQSLKTGRDNCFFKYIDPDVRLQVLWRIT